MLMLSTCKTVDPCNIVLRLGGGKSEGSCATIVLIVRWVCSSVGRQAEDWNEGERFVGNQQCSWGFYGFPRIAKCQDSTQANRPLILLVFTFCEFRVG